MSEDYAPAVWRPAHSANRSGAYWRKGKDIDRIVIHVSGGDANSAWNTFVNPERQASYHYLVSEDAAVFQFVKEAEVAWHAGYWPTNQRSVSVAMAGSLEHNRDKTDDMYLAMARIVAHLSRRYSIPLDRRAVIGHYEVPGCSQKGLGGFDCHADPGEDFRWRYMLGRARVYKKEAKPA